MAVVLTAETVEGEGATDGSEPVHLAAFDAADGALRWQVELEAGDEVREVVVADGRVWAVIASVDDTISVIEVDPDGEVVASSSFSGTTGGIAALPAGGAFAVLDGGVVLAAAGSDDSTAVTWDVVGRDVVTHDGGVTMLFETPDDGSVAVTFGT